MYITDNVSRVTLKWYMKHIGCWGKGLTNTDPMFTQRWPTVCDAGPALVQHKIQRVCRAAYAADICKVFCSEILKHLPEITVVY